MLALILVVARWCSVGACSGGTHPQEHMQEMISSTRRACVSESITCGVHELVVLLLWIVS